MKRKIKSSTMQRRLAAQALSNITSEIVGDQTPKQQQPVIRRMSVRKERTGALVVARTSVR